MNKPLVDYSRLASLDFARNAPRCEVIVYRPEQPQPRGELATVCIHIGIALHLIWVCLCIAAKIISRRTLLSLKTAWLFAGIGWGGFLAFPLILHFTR